MKLMQGTLVGTGEWHKFVKMTDWFTCLVVILSKTAYNFFNWNPSYNISSLARCDTVSINT
jgi:hypothetical protein